MASLERRLQELERKLDAVLALTPDGTRGGGPPIAQPGRIDPDTIRRIRPRFECLVEKVVVKAGQAVKKGDPLAELFSPELAAAKNDLLARTLQWDHDKRLLDLRKKLVETGAIGSQLWTDTQNDEARSRLEAAVARDHLRLYGLGEREIDAVKDEDGEKKARFTLRAPEDGTVIEVVAAPDDLAGPKGVLLVIAGSKR